MAERRRAFAVGAGEAAGAVADLGVLVPLSAALVLVNGLDPGAVLAIAGLLVIVAGVVFRIPFPVQPLKALTAVAVAQHLSPGVIHAAGLEIGAFLLLLSVRRVADGMARLFTLPVIRALQLGVGALLVIAATRLALDPPPVFRGTPPSPWPVLLAVAAFLVVAWTARSGRPGVALAVLGAGLAAALVVAAPSLGPPSPSLPLPALPSPGAFGTAFLLLVIPQLPLTFGNAVVAVSDLSRQYFGPRAGRVSPSRVCLVCGGANLVAGVLGGMPMCHGAAGLTAHVRLGARTAGMNLVLGAVLLALGLLFAPQATALLGLLPVWALAGFLAYAGLRHAALVLDLRGRDLAVALAAGALGAALANLAVTAAVALAVEWIPPLQGRAGPPRPAGPEPAAARTRPRPPAPR